MIHRLRVYHPSPAELERSHAIFYEEVLPVHLEHGARFVGRWTTEDGRLVVLWEYDSHSECLRIQEAVARDPRTLDRGSRRTRDGLLQVEREEWLLTPTAPSADFGNSSADSS